MRYTLLAVLFSLLWAAAFIGVKVALRSPPPLFLMAFRFLVAGGLTRPGARPPFLAAQAFLILGVSCLGMLIWFWLLHRGDASRASAYFFLNPVLGLFLGAVLLGEPLHLEDFAGSAAVAVGIYVVQRA